MASEVVADVEKHNTDDDVWIAIHDKVYDLTGKLRFLLCHKPLHILTFTSILCVAIVILFMDGRLR